MLKKVRHFYEKYEIPLSYGSLFLGFIIDSFTLTRVDRMFDLFWVLGHVMVASIALIIFNKFYTKPKIKFLAELAIQFAFGGLLSACLVFYARGATLSYNWPFILILLAAFVCSEYFKKHFEKMALQVSFLFFALFSFSIFFVPVIIGRIGDIIFILSGIMSLIFISIFLAILYGTTKEKFKESRKYVFISIIGIFVSINILYFTNLIPPLPLSLKDAGAYTNIIKTNDGYVLEGEQNTFATLHGLRLKHFSYNDNIYVYTAIFAPANISIPIVHEWQYYDTTAKKWKTHSTIKLKIIGGRDEGFRTYSKSYSQSKGKWRVNVRTEPGALIGRVQFVVE